MERPSSTPAHQVEIELELAQSRTAEFVHGLDRGIREAELNMFEAQGAPDVGSPHVYREVIKQVRAEGKGRYDREGARAFYYGIRAGIDSVVELQGKKSSKGTEAQADAPSSSGRYVEEYEPEPEFVRDRTAYNRAAARAAARRHDAAFGTDTARRYRSR
jgi:hypothetical protein